MKSNGLIFLFLLSVCSETGISQTSSIDGLELGITFSKFPAKSEWSDQYSSRTEKSAPVFRPVLGVSREWTISKHINLKCGFQYQMAGEKIYKLNKAMMGDTIFYENSIEIRESINIHKICLLFTAGYVFSTGIVKPSLFIGARPNILLFCNMIYKEHTHYESPGSEDTYYKSKLNLFVHDKEPFIHPKRLVIQLITGFAVQIGQFYKIEISYNLGYNNYAQGYEVMKIPSSDFVISLKYLLKQTEKNKQRTS